MKPVLLFILVALQSLAFGQITFEEITSPPDFNIKAVRKSPVGEYFVQAVNDRESIYSSLDGQVWTKSTLPESHTLREIQFFSDGTPLLTAEYNASLIRRNGAWHTMRFNDTWQDVEACFVRNDTLFVYHENSFGYSLDKGMTFLTLFSSSEINGSHSAHLWKFEHHFVLHHTLGASDFLSVFNAAGTRVLFQPLDVSAPDYTYNECGQVLINDRENYYFLKEEDLQFQSGATSTIIPSYTTGAYLLSQHGQYYLRVGNKIYRTTGCNFTWELLVNDWLIQSGDDVWINHLGDIFLAGIRRDFFLERTNGSTQWESHAPDINHALVYTIDESQDHHQATLTSNYFFHKQLAEIDWHKTDSIGGYNYQVKYAPNGDLYVNRKGDIQYSNDHGVSFSTITLPDSDIFEKSYSMEVLDNDMLFIIDGQLGRCFYTLNNGQHWIQPNLTLFPDIPKAKLVNGYIIVAEMEYRYEVSRINIATNEVESESVGDFFNLDYFGSVILDDGTIYFHGFDFANGTPEGLYRYRFGEGHEYLGQFEELSYIYALHASGQDVYAFRPDKYFVVSGNSIEGFDYEGLPGNGEHNFIVTANDYVYAIINNHRIFRSTKPLSSPYLVSGKVQHDADESCTQDTLDAALQFWQVTVEGENYLRIKNTDSKGNFGFRVPAGEYTLSTRPVNENWDLCTDAYLISIDEDTTVVTQDFQAIGLSDCADLEIDFSTPLLRRCFENYYSIRVRNTGPEATEGTTLKLTLDPFFDFNSATIPFTLIGDSVLTFDLGAMGVNDEIIFRIFFTLSCDADLGIEHCLTGILMDDNICGDSRSMYTECQMNIGSYDPNDKRVFNGHGMETETVDKGEYIYYHIRFQNTGTDTAFKVRILDPLSPKLDLSTLEMLSASHAYEYVITDGPALEVTFDNILLPDSSTNEAASNGYVKFRIKPLSRI